jgi:adenosine deaminase
VTETNLRDFIQSLPKAELHLHIEGTLEPEHMLALAERNGVALRYADAQAARDAYEFDNLQSFLDLYYEGMQVLRTEQDFRDLTLAYLERAHADNVVHAEIFFDPQAHVSRGIPFEVAIEGILAGLEEGEQRLGVTSGLILCFLRDMPAESAAQTLAAARPWLDRLVGVGLDSAEVGYPPSLFTEVFAEAHRLGLHRVAHAGEEGPPAYISEALDLLGAERIDHGIKTIDDPALVERLAASGIALTVCPLSNQRLAVTPDLAAHPLKEMIDAGLNVTINSDDPAYFGGYVGANFIAAAEQMRLDRADLARCARNSLEAAFVQTDATRRALKVLDGMSAA